MVSEEIEQVYKNRKEISKEYLKQDSRFGLIVEWNNDPNIKDTHIASEEQANNLKEFYLNKIGEENIKNSPDYDPDLVSIDRQYGTIDDLNFPPSFAGTFIKCLLIDFGLWMLMSFAAVFTGMLLFGFIGLGGIIVFTIAAFFYRREQCKELKNSSKKSQDITQKFNRVKYAPILALFVVLILNYGLGFFISV